MNQPRIEGTPARTVKNEDDAINYLLEAIQVHDESHGIESAFTDGGLAKIEAKKWGSASNPAGQGIILNVDGVPYRIKIDRG